MAKNTHTFQNEIKHYNKIRNILRYLYLYDISSLDEFLEKNWLIAPVLFIIPVYGLKTILIVNTYKNQKLSKRLLVKNFI